MKLYYLSVAEAIDIFDKKLDIYAIKSVQNEKILFNDELLQAHGITSRTFLRYWKMIQPLPPNKYINYLRIEEAKRLLKTTRGRINDIAEQIGFDDPFYFTRIFRKQVGIPPIKYRHQVTP